MTLTVLLRHISTRPLVACAGALLLAGCASIPEAVRTPVDGPTVPAARADPQTHSGVEVRWGGTISDVENLEDRTFLTVVARPVTRRGEPLGEQASTGRFLAEFDRFLDPDVYRPGRRVTVVGRFTGIRPASIDQYIYDYPLVHGRDLHLWEDYVRPAPRYPRPYYHRYPYWHYPYAGFHRYPWWWY